MAEQFSGLIKQVNERKEIYNIFINSDDPNEYIADRLNFSTYLMDPEYWSEFLPDNHTTPFDMAEYLMLELEEKCDSISLHLLEAEFIPPDDMTAVLNFKEWSAKNRTGLPLAFTDLCDPKENETPFLLTALHSIKDKIRRGGKDPDSRSLEVE